MPSRQQHAAAPARLPHPALAHLDPQTAFLYAPHTVSMLLLGLALLAWRAAVFAATSHTASPEAGIKAALLVFLGYSVLQGPRTSMVRPHPAVWRLVHGMAVAYMVSLVWLLFQSRASAREFLKHLSPSLGVPVVYRDYGGACALTPANLAATLWDPFVLAHSLGWWAKALLIRNTSLLWIYSVAFELLEASAAHMLPNFNECWWDSWLLDVAICNTLGIYTGMATVRWLECRYTAYNWQGISELPGLLQKARRGVKQLLPASWSKLDWMVFSSPARFLQSLAVVAAFLVVELNVFFLKFCLWVPPTHWLNTARLLLWLAVGAPAVREYYEYIQGDTAAQTMVGGFTFHRLGHFAWLGLAMLALESMLSIKFGRGLYLEPWPRRVQWAWGAAGAAAACLLAVWQTQVWQQQRQKEQQQQQQRQQRRLHLGERSKSCLGSGKSE